MCSVWDYFRHIGMHNKKRRIDRCLDEQEKHRPLWQAETDAFLGGVLVDDDIDLQRITMELYLQAARGENPDFSVLPASLRAKCYEKFSSDKETCDAIIALMDAASRVSMAKPEA